MTDFLYFVDLIDLVCAHAHQLQIENTRVEIENQNQTSPKSSIWIRFSINLQFSRRQAQVSNEVVDQFLLSLTTKCLKIFSLLTCFEDKHENYFMLHTENCSAMVMYYAKLRWQNFKQKTKQKLKMKLIQITTLETQWDSQCEVKIVVVGRW